MSELRYSAATAAEQAGAYIAALQRALGARDPIEVLREMPEAVGRSLTGLSAEQRLRPEAPGKWSLCQIVQHLADSDMVGAFRFRMVLAHDRPALPGYDQDRWVESAHRGDADVEAALAEFTAVRRANVRLLERTTPGERERVGLHAERGPESLEFLMRMHAGHDVVHLRQLARVRHAVAPGSPEIPAPGT